MADCLHLQPKHRRVLEALLREHLPDVEVWAYGSRVSGRSHDGSDLDLVLRGPSLKEIPIGQLGDFEEAVRESTIPFLVEARDWTRLPERFHREIERTHVVLSDSSERYAGSGWDECTLVDACLTIDYGLTASATNNKTGSQFLRITDIVSGSIDWNTVPYVVADAQTVSKYQLHNDDIVIARTGASTGCSSYIKSPPPSVFASYLVRLQPKPEFDGRFLSYYLKSDMFWSYIRGVLGDKSAQPNASASTMTKAPLTFPRNIDEQRAIAHVLGTLDDKIELNRRMNETLEAMARALFKSWFVDFDLVRAKMEGRDPGLPKPLAELFPDRLVDSELGEIPEGWGIFHLDQLANHHTKSTTPSSSPDTEFEHFSIPAYDSRHVPAIEKGVEIKSNKTVMPLDSILLSKLNPEIPRIWMPDTSSCGPQICSTEFLVFTPRSPANRSILFSLFTDGVFRSLLQSMVTGTSKSHQRVPPKALKQCQVISGTPTLFGKFGQVTVSTLNQVVEKRGESKNLATLRDVLLPKLISGEIRLREAEKVVEAVA